MTTKDDVQSSINSRLQTEPTLIEGGTVQDIVGSVSYELANIIDTKIDVILDNAFVTTADEKHLLIKGSELGVYKKEATSSYVFAKITDALPNTIITTDIQAKTSSNIIFQVIEEAVADENGEAVVKMECLTEGSVGNIQIGALNEFCDSYEGLTTAEITNEKKGYDGYNEETVEEYRARILEYMKDDACNSNISDYILWAKSVSGVKNVVVKDAMQAGAGNVGVYISAINNETVSNELKLQVKEKIEKEQIINANVSIGALSYLSVNITANVTLKDGYDISTVKNEFAELLENYLDTRPSVVSYLYISNLFFDTDGILDVSNYLLNNASQSVEIGELEIPVKGTITLSVEEE